MTSHVRDEYAFPDSYLMRMTKYTPVEVLLGWVVVNAMINGSGPDVPKKTIAWVAFAFFTVVTPVWLWRMTSTRMWPMPTTQLVLATISFVLWVFALGGPFTQLSYYNPLYGAMALLMYSLVIPVIVASPPGARDHFGTGTGL